MFIKCAGGEQLGIKRYWGDLPWAIFKDFVLIVVAQLESSTELRGWGGGRGIYIDSQQEQSLETSEDKYAILLSGRTKIQSRAQASCGPEIMGISVGNFFFLFLVSLFASKRRKLLRNYKCK